MSTYICTYNTYIYMYISYIHIHIYIYISYQCFKLLAKLLGGHRISTAHVGLFRLVIHDGMPRRHRHLREDLVRKRR